VPSRVPKEVGCVVRSPANVVDEKIRLLTKVNRERGGGEHELLGKLEAPEPAAEEAEKKTSRARRSGGRSVRS